MEEKKTTKKTTKKKKKTTNLFSTSGSSSAEEFLASAVSRYTSKQLKSAIRTLIFDIPHSSPLTSSLPPTLFSAIESSLDSFKNGVGGECADTTASPLSPPKKQLRRSYPKRKDYRSPKPTGAKDTRTAASDHLKRLRIYSEVAKFCVLHPQKCFDPVQILPAVQLLHGGLGQYEIDPLLQSVVAGFCEEWWKEGLPGRENLISQSLPYFLSKSLINGRKSDVHRVFTLKEAFTLFDFDDESIVDLRLLLLRCLVSPLYLKTDEGKRFISFALGFNDQLLRESLALIKVQIPLGKKSVLDAYGEILFRTWKSLNGDMKGEIENSFLQPLIDGTVHASSDVLASSMRRVLRGFLDHRTIEGVDKLLFRLAEPVLFRSLQVANSNVRLNALHLLIDLFPLEDPDVTRDTKEAMLLKQFFLLDKLLLDDCTDIRVVSVEGACRILNFFWEVIPPPTITRILTKIIDDISRDTCYEVRLSVVNGLIYLLGNPQAHEILKRLLPRVGFLFLDPVLSVRVAVGDLLLTVRDIHTFQCYKIVKLDDLLSSLANDHPLVARKITRLLMASYFPSERTINEACHRCIALIKRSPSAGARFCNFALLEGSLPKSLAELVSTFVNLLLSAKDLTPDQVDGLFAACANICRTLYSETSSKRAHAELISSDKFKHLLNVATSTHSQTSVLIIASIMPPVNLSGLKEHCIHLVMNFRNLFENRNLQAEIKTAHKLILSCDFLRDFLEALTGTLEKAAYKFHTIFKIQVPKDILESLKKNKCQLLKKDPFKSNNANGDKSLISDISSFEDDYALVSTVSWHLKELLMFEGTRKATLNSITFSVYSALGICAQVCIERYLDALDISPLLAYTSVALHMSLNTSETSKNYNVDSHCHRSPSKKTILRNTTSHLIDSITKFFSKMDSDADRNSVSARKKVEESGQVRRSKRKLHTEEESATKSCKDRTDDSYEEKNKPHFLMIATAVLQYIMDSVEIGLSILDWPRCLQFAAAYACYVISVLQEVKKHNSPFDLGAFMFINRSFTYASKLLHLFLSSIVSSSAPPEASYLANCLLDLVISIELYAGYKYALRFIPVVKEWLPDLILGLCSSHLNHRTWQKVDSSMADAHLSLWLTTLSKIELHEVIEIDKDAQNHSTTGTDSGGSVLSIVLEKVVLLLKNGNLEIMSAIIVSFLSHVKDGFDRGDFDLVLGLLHFVCVKLLDSKPSKWKELEIRINSLEDFYLLTESNMSDTRVSEDGRCKLKRARDILKCFVSDT